MTRVAFDISDRLVCIMREVEVLDELKKNSSLPAKIYEVLQSRHESSREYGHTTRIRVLAKIGFRRKMFSSTDKRINELQNKTCDA